MITLLGVVMTIAFVMVVILYVDHLFWKHGIRAPEWFEAAVAIISVLLVAVYIAFTGVLDHIIHSDKSYRSLPRHR